MYYSFTVPIPKAQGKITRMKKGKFTYIWYQIINQTGTVEVSLSS